MRTLLISLALTLTACDAGGVSKNAVGGGVPRAGQPYIVRQGDNLYRLAEKSYGNGLEWRRIWEANPWVDPQHLVPGQEIHLPLPSFEEAVPNGPVSPIEEIGRGGGDRLAPFRALAESEASGRGVEPGEGAPIDADAGPNAGRSAHSNPGSSTSMWHTLRQRVANKTFFGLTLDKISFYVLLGCILHALFQGFVVWIMSNITFVKDASLKKSLHATFLTEMLSLCTVALLAAVGLMMVYAGTTEPADAAQSSLFPALEQYLNTRAGMALVGAAVLCLYVLLSLRFIPQVFGIQRSQAFTVVFLGVLLPHLAAAYLMGQRMGLL